MDESFARIILNNTRRTNKLILSELDKLDEISIKDLVIRTNLPEDMIRLRLEVLSVMNIIEYDIDKETIKKGIRFSKDVETPVHADELHLSPRDKEIVIAISTAGVASSFQIRDILKHDDDTEPERLIDIIRDYLRRLKKKGVIEEIPGYKRPKLYRLLLDIIVFENVKELCRICKEMYYERVGQTREKGRQD